MPTPEGGGSVVGGHRSPGPSVDVGDLTDARIVARPNVAGLHDHFPASRVHGPDKQDATPDGALVGVDLKRTDGLLP